MTPKSIIVEDSTIKKALLNPLHCLIRRNTSTYFANDSKNHNREVADLPNRNHQIMFSTGTKPGGE